MNKLIVIGFMGDKNCYLNMSRQEAQERFLRDNPDYWSMAEIESRTTEFTFNDEFYAYDVWGATP